MKTIKTLLLLMLLVSSTFADASMDEKIQAIQNAAPEDRVELVNEFKILLSTMSENERATAITQLRSSMSTNSEQTPIRDRSCTNQMNENQEIQKNQQMNQRFNKAGSGDGAKNQFMRKGM